MKLQTQAVLMAIALSILLSSCATSPDSSKPAREPKSGVKTEKTNDRTNADEDEGEILLGNGSCPKILRLGFTDLQMGSSEIHPVKESREKSPVFLFLELQDPNWDLKCVHIKAESPGSKTEEFDIELEYQYEERFLFMHPLTSSSHGKWTFTARAEDHAGNLSATKRCSIEIKPE